MANLKRLKNKIYSIVILGGKCLECGAYLLPSQYDLHHPDGRSPDTPRDLMGLSREELDKELEDVVLLCANCHRLEHSSYNEDELDMLNIFEDYDEEDDA